MRVPEFIQRYPFDAATVAQELLRGLTAPQAHTSPKFLYDSLGSRLFEAITELPEYDLTRNEAQLMAVHGEAMVARLPGGACCRPILPASCASGPMNTPGRTM